MPSYSSLLALIAILAAGVSAYLYFAIGDEKNQLRSELATSNRLLDSSRERLSEEESAHRQLQSEAETLRNDLSETRARLAGSEARAQQFQQDLQETRRVVAAKERNEAVLSRELATLRQELADARTLVARAGQTGEYQRRIESLERLVADLETRTTADSRQSAPGTMQSDAPDTFPGVPRDLEASVLSVGPHDAFVILDIGSGQGAMRGLPMRLRRGPEIVAHIQLVDVRTNLSVAHIVPGTITGRLQEGDTAIR